jgi:hypothetical protein
MTRSTAVLVDAQITQLYDHRGLGRHFLAIAPNGGSVRVISGPSFLCVLLPVCQRRTSRPVAA